MERPPPSPNAKHDLSAEWLRALVDNALDGVVTMDGAGRIIAFNHAAEEIFGYPREAVIGRLVSEKLIPQQMRVAHEKGLSHFLATGDGRIVGRRVEITAMRADGSTFPAEIEVISVSPETAPVFIAYIRDISEHKQIADERRQYAKSIKKTLLQTILAVSRMAEIRDPYTAGHQRRVAHLAATMAQAMGLSEQRIEGIFFGALIHDIGKIAVPSEILSRPGRLAGEDIEYLHIHCHKGYEILQPVDFPWPVAEIALQHHEHLDGSGYPQGLRDGDIRLEARIVAVADVVEALTAHRPYRPARPLHEALATIADNAGTWYDRDAAATCIALFEQGYQIDAADMVELGWLASSP